MTRSAPRWRCWMQDVMAVDGPPERVAAACALGVFFSFSPFLGLQTLLAMGVAFALRLNKIAVFVGLNANLPWFMGPWYAATTAGAAALMGVSLSTSWSQLRLAFSAQGPWLQAWPDMLQPLVWPFLAGASVGAAVVASVAYAAVMATLRRRARGTRRTPAVRDSWQEH